MYSRTTKLLLFCLLMIAAATTQAQTFRPVSTSGGGFNVETGSKTDSTFTVDGRTFEIFQTGKGSKYIKCTSARTGNAYPVWVGEKTEFNHEDRPVYRSKKGSYCIYKLSEKTGNPYPVWLKME